MSNQPKTAGDAGRYDQGRAAAQRASEVLQRIAAMVDRKGGTTVVDPRDNPNANKWLDNLADCIQPEQIQVQKPCLQGAVETMIRSKAFQHWLDCGKKGASGEVVVRGSLWELGNALRSNLGHYRTNTVNVGTVADIRDQLATSYLPGIVPLGIRTTRIRDLFTVLPTKSGMVSVLRETGFTNSAAAVPENTDPDSVTTKPTSRITITQVQRAVRTIAHIIEFPNELIDDVDGLMAYLQARMGDGIDDEEDDQFLHGSGVAPNQLGLYNDPDVPQYNWSDGASGDNRADAFLSAIGELWAANYMATGIAMSFTDWVRIMKLKDDQKQYLFPSAQAYGVPTTLWGFPVATSNAHTLGQAAVGAFANVSAAAIHDRQQTTMRVTDSHGTRFAENISTLRVEKRCLLLLTRPESFRQVALDSAPTGTES